MVVFLITTISCTQAIGIVRRVTQIVGLTEVQKIEIIQEIRKVVPSCPITVKENGK